MSDVDVALRAEQFDALLDALDANRSVNFEDLYVRREPKSETYEFEANEVYRDDLSEAGLHEVATEHAAYVANWHFWTRTVGERGSHRRAFLRWLEDADAHDVLPRYARLADGVSKEWGQLLVAVTVDEDGSRSYELRHVDDADASEGDLRAHEDPLDAREIGALDEDGRYRPLRTAPSLRTGWIFPDLDARGLYEAVEAFYPATVANWHREREGRLDVDHWREVSERQTGMFDVVDELPDEAVEWMASACCVDSQCLRRREWHLDEETELDADPGDGVFPCREPCSLVVAASRKWTMLEREEAQTYEFDLTPSEKEQLEELIDAVADGRIDEIREADLGEGANRYRARYLREKRFDEDGNLSGTSTNRED